MVLKFRLGPAYLLPRTSRVPGACSLNLYLHLLLVAYPRKFSLSLCQEVCIPVVYVLALVAWTLDKYKPVGLLLRRGFFYYYRNGNHFRTTVVDDGDGHVMPCTEHVDLRHTGTCQTVSERVSRNLS